MTIDYDIKFFSVMLLLQSGSDKEKETKLRGEIKELLKEASSLSQ